MVDLRTIRAEHIGSFMRPAHLMGARSLFDRGSLAADELHRIEDKAILSAIALQESAGLDVVTDGEFRRREFSGSFRDNVEGYERFDPALLTEPSGTRMGLSVGLVRPFVQRRTLIADETAFLIGKTNRQIKVTVPAPSTYTRLWYPGVSDKVYPTRHDYLQAIAVIMRRAVEEIAALGIDYIQVDAPYYAYLIHPEMTGAMLGPNVQWAEVIEDMLAADNVVLADLPGVTFGVHTCRGNHSNLYIASGSYELIAERVFNGLHCSRLLLEYDGPRAGGFEPLRHVPSDKSVALGLISTKEDRLETRDELLARIEEASRYIPIDRLAISPQCGFGLIAHEPNLIPVELQNEKLKLVGTIAAEVWTK